MTRREIEERVASIAAAHGGAALVGEVRRFADELSDAERKVLGDVLLERGRAQDADRYPEMTERMRAARWRLVLPPGRERPKAE